MRTSTLLTFCLLLIVAVGHLLRLVFAVPVTAGGVVVPMWISVVATIVPAALAAGLWREHHVR
jgi:hypothetical protein